MAELLTKSLMMADMKITVSRVTQEVKHPRTGEVLERIVEESITTTGALSDSGFTTGDLVTLD